jgi:hypothetical protein
MQIKATLDLSEWQRAARRFVDQLGYTMRMIVVEEVRELLKLAIDFTPPHTKPNVHMRKRGRSRTPARVVGLRAVERDILKTMRPLRPDDFDNKDMKRILRTRDTAAYIRFINFLPKTSPLAGTQPVAFSPKEHTTRRDSRGRVRRDYKQVVLGDTQSDKLDAYIEKVQGYVGWSKAGWAAAFTMVGGKLPAYVARHNWRASAAVSDLNNKKEPTITLYNRTNWGVRDGQRILAAARDIRVKKMRSKLNYGLRQVAKANGMA